MKRIISILILLCLCLSGCSLPEKNEGVSVVAVSFPGYSFAKELVGDKGEVTLLLPLGSEAHGYEPTPKDMMKIQDCDLFIYGGGDSENWVEEVLSASENNIRTVKMISCADEISHEGHDHGTDEHVWTSPKNAKNIVKTIADALCDADGQNREFYQKNKNAYLEKLDGLDKAYEKEFSNQKTEIVMADRFPFLHLAESYGIKYRAAFPGCAGESEPSAATVAELIDYVKKEKIPTVYYTEFSNREVADAICNATGAKSLMLHSCHNVSVEDFEKGESYLSLMERNLQHLKEAR